MTAADAAAEVMRLAREWSATGRHAAYAALDAAVTALAERAYPAPGEWRQGGFQFLLADVMRRERPVSSVCVDLRDSEVSVTSLFGNRLKPAEARELAARLVEAADRLDAATP